MRAALALAAFALVPVAAAVGLLETGEEGTLVRVEEGPPRSYRLLGEADVRIRAAGTGELAFEGTVTNATEATVALDPSDPASCWRGWCGVFRVEARADREGRLLFVPEDPAEAGVSVAVARSTAPVAATVAPPPGPPAPPPEREAPQEAGGLSSASYVAGPGLPGAAGIAVAVALLARRRR